MIVLNTKVMLIEPVDWERRLRQEVGRKRVLTKLIEIRNSSETPPNSACLPSERSCRM